MEGLAREKMGHVMEGECRQGRKDVCMAYQRVNGHILR
jgi:hypothetical protein